jgi:hypothetical protein
VIGFTQESLIGFTGIRTGLPPAIASHRSAQARSARISRRQTSSGSGGRRSARTTRPSSGGRGRENGQETVAAGELENPLSIRRALGEQPVQAGLTGAGPVRGQFVARPLGHQALGDRRATVRRFRLAPLDLEAAVGNPGFEQFASAMR